MLSIKPLAAALSSGLCSLHSTPRGMETESLKGLAYTRINSPLNVDEQKWQVTVHKGTGFLFIFTF